MDAGQPDSPPDDLVVIEVTAGAEVAAPPDAAVAADTAPSIEQRQSQGQSQCQSQCQSECQGEGRVGRRQSQGTSQDTSQDAPLQPVSRHPP